MPRRRRSVVIALSPNIGVESPSGYRWDDIRFFLRELSACSRISGSHAISLQYPHSCLFVRVLYGFLLLVECLIQRPVEYQSVEIGSDRFVALLVCKKYLRENDSLKKI